jgi:hypothetical protein
MACVKEPNAEGNHSEETYQEKKSAIQEEIDVLRHEFGKLEDLDRV